MTRSETAERIVRSGVIAIVRSRSAATAAEAVDAIQAGGVECIEVTMTVPGALDLLSVLRDRYEDRVLLGAGTVLDPETVRQAVLAGARYIVSPHLKHETVDACVSCGVPAIPGCQTVTEAMAALEMGAELIKLFPASVLGSGFIRAVLSALPHIPFVPTGGVGPGNAGDWIQAGAVAVGVGGELTRAGSPAEIAAAAARLLAEVQAARRGGGRRP
jgi:2-dehydro-3-deoxyphosphogluconate aldolase / (4S)-4-hydroxy-2-oxoglutarate aldolase